MYLLVMGWRNECYLGQSNRHELKKACVPLSRKNICESTSLISVSAVSQAQVECIQMNPLIIQEKQAMNVTSVLVK